MNPRPAPPLPRRSPRSVAAGLLLVFGPAALLAWHAVGRNAGHDYIQFHAAARLIAGGENPYGLAEQLRAQRPLRGGAALREVEPGDPYAEIGVLPYFYPPWVALACLPLTALSFPAARAAWVASGALALAASGPGLARLSGGRLFPAAGVALAVGLMPGYCSVLIGQTPPFVLLLLVTVWACLERGADRAAGLALAWLSVKPQLTVVVVPAVLLWSARRGRWGVVGGFALMLGTLAAVSTWAYPRWPVEMLLATRRIPVPTAMDPSVGVTWLSALRTLGLNGPALAAGYAGGAGLAAAVALRAAWDRARPVSDVIGLGVLAAFAVSPYSLGYDLAVLAFPMAAALATLSGRATFWALTVAVVGPYLNLTLLTRGVPPVTLAWGPAALAALWAVRASRQGGGISQRSTPRLGSTAV